MSVLRTQISGVARRPARLLITGLAIVVASFVVFATVLAQQITERTVLSTVSGATVPAVDLVVGGGDGREPVAGSVLKKIQQVPGVAEAVGRYTDGIAMGDSYLMVAADPGSGPLAMTRMVQGSFPASTGEIAVTRRTADRMGLTVGTTTTVRVGEQRKAVALTVTGLVEGEQDYGGEAYARLDTVQQLSGTNVVQGIEVRLSPGASPATVRSRIQAIVDAAARPEPARPAGLDAAAPQVDVAAGSRRDAPTPVRTGDEVRADEARQVAADFKELFLVVGMFVAIAVLAAILVATSTFRIVFAQRMRQLALLRAVGAGRRSIKRALVVEGVLTGAITGTVGVLAALMVGHAVPPLLRLFDVRVSSPGLPVVEAVAVVLMAVVITVVAVLAPARAASKVAPLEALRTATTTSGRHDIGKLRWLLGLLLAGAAAVSALGVVAFIAGKSAPNDDPTAAMLILLLSAALAFFTLVVLGPALVQPLLRVLGWPLRRLGPVGQLAVGGVGGAPRRAAAVCVVVALGVSLIASAVVTGASARELSQRELGLLAPADFKLTAAEGTSIPGSLLGQTRARTELTNVTPYRLLSDVTVGGSKQSFDANDVAITALPSLAEITAASGSIADLGRGKAVLADYVASNAGLTVGDSAAITAQGRTVTVTVAAILHGLAPLNSGLILHSSDMDSIAPKAGYSGVLADAAAAGEQGRTAGWRALGQLREGRTGLGIEVLADQRDQFEADINMALGIIVSLFGLTVLISVVGVGATTALSVVERIRESGLLRAVGLSRGGLRTMLTLESSLYGFIGASTGLMLGIAYGSLAIKAISTDAPLVLPVGQLAAVLLVLVVFTAVAGVLPARRAARVSPVAALGSDD